MKQSFLSVLVCALGVFAASAFAHEPAPAETCKMTFDVRVDVAAIFSNGYGTARVLCRDAAGNVIHGQDLNVAIRGIGFGLFGTFRLVGESTALPNADLRGYYDVNMGADGVGGIEVTPFLEFRNRAWNGPSFQTMITAGNGVGIFNNQTVWTLY